MTTHLHTTNGRGTGLGDHPPRTAKATSSLPASAQQVEPALRGLHHTPQPLAPSTPDLLKPDWKQFWQNVSTTLQQRDYTPASIALYRTVLRNFYRHASVPPTAINSTITHNYIHALAEQNFSWSWIGMNISVLRNVFDKLANADLTARLVTPKRPQRLPEILSHAEVRQILAAATTTRDQLLLGLLYGCGLKVGELCQLRWQDINVQDSTLCINYNRRAKQRTTPAQRSLPIPPDLLPVLTAGKTRCPASDYVFQGRIGAGLPSGRSGATHLSTRMIELILRKAVQSTQTLKTVTCMTLRHSFAVHCLENGHSIRAIQEALGHDSVKTTMLYESCCLPKGATSPLDELKRKHSTAPRTYEQQVGRGVPSEPPPFEHLHLPPSSVRNSLFDIQCSIPPLFDQPLSIDELELPFQNEHTPSLTARFYTLLKTQIAGRFLASRRANAPPG